MNAAIQRLRAEVRADVATFEARIERWAVRPIGRDDFVRLDGLLQELAAH